MYFPDLSPYREHPVPTQDRVRHVGWLSAEHAYNQGSVEREILKKLECIAVNSTVNQTRGFYRCKFCDEERVIAECGERVELLGSAEVWVPSGDGTIYAAPDLICHYIKRHTYHPPVQFIDAVRALEIDRYDAEALFAEVVEPRFR